jgi:DNA-binding NarL/FixJ family response regulator
MSRPLRTLCATGHPDRDDAVRLALAREVKAFALTMAAQCQEFETLLAGGRWDVVISDIAPFGYEALQIIARVHASDPRVAVIILTADGSERVAAEAIKLGAADYLVSSGEQLGRLSDTLRGAVARQLNLMSASELAAVLDTSADGILVVSRAGRVIHSNQRVRDMWKIPDGLPMGQDLGALQQIVAEQLLSPQASFENMRHAFDTDSRSFDVLEFKDGRIFERRSEPQVLGDKTIGRVISYRDVTGMVQAEQRLKRSIALQSASRF